MLSEKVCSNIAMIKKLMDETDELIKEETGGNYGLCNGSTPQLYCYKERMHEHSVEELMDLVGHIEKVYVYPNGNETYMFFLNGVMCHIIMPAITHDAPMGGASNDVSIN